MTRLLRWRWLTSGMEHVPTSGPAVVTWNHHGALDWMATACEIYLALGRPVRVLVARSMYEHPLLRWMFRLVGAIPAGRGDEGRSAALDEAIAALAAGHLVMVAPEGRMSPDLSLQEFRTGATRMAQRSGAPLVPSAGLGTHLVTRPGQALNVRAAWRLPVAVRFGRAESVAPADDLKAATQALRARTQALLDEARADLSSAA